MTINGSPPLVDTPEEVGALLVLILAMWGIAFYWHFKIYGGGPDGDK